MIKDLLWSCVVCGAPESLRVDRKTERCEECGASYARGDGAEIVVETKDGRREVRRAGEWAAMLPPVVPAGSATCSLSIAHSDEPIHSYGEYFGRFEKFGEARIGTMSLDGDALSFEVDGETDRWPLLDLSAIQLSSSTLQVKPKRRPVMTIRFAQSSPKLWQERLEKAVREAYARAGLGDVVEFQPRIVTR